MSTLLQEYARASRPIKLTFIAAGLATIFLLSLAAMGPSHTHPTNSVSLARSGHIIHMVLFKYAPSTPPAAKAEVAAAFLALKDTCRLANQKKYILSIDGGSNISPENAGKGMEHAYVVTFKSAADRDYYVHDDLAHFAFKASLGDKIQDVLVFDFESGQFQKQSATLHRRNEDIHVRTV